MKTAKKILKVIGIVFAVSIGLFVLLLVIVGTGSNKNTKKKAQAPTAEPELLIAPAADNVPTRMPTSTPYGNDIYVTLTAIVANRQAAPTPTVFQAVRNAAPPVYDGNNNLLGYVGDATATPVYAAPVQTVFCLNIKGNVNWNGEYIYHCPHWRDYDITTIVPGEGDRYFCTEEEAKAAGFREARYSHGSCR